MIISDDFWHDVFFCFDENFATKFVGTLGMPMHTTQLDQVKCQQNNETRDSSDTRQSEKDGEINEVTTSKIYQSEKHL